MSEERQIASLFATLGFKVDDSGLKAFEARLKSLQVQAQALNKSVQNTLSGAGAKPALAHSKQLVSQQKTALQLQGASLRNLVTQQKLSAAEFKAKLENSKLTLATQTAEHRQAVNLLRLDRERQALQRSGLQTSIAQHRLAQAAARTRQIELKSKQAAERIRSGVSNHRGYQTAQNLGNSLRHSLPVGAVGGAAFAGLDALGGAVSPLTLAFTALTAVTIGLQRKFSELAQIDVGNSDARNVERAQLSVLTDGDKAKAQAVESDITAFANEIGVLRQSIAPAFATTATNLKDAGLQQSQATDLLKGIMRFGRATGTTSEDIGGALRAIQQAVGKNQLYKEEWGQQFSDRVAGANKLGTEAWAKASGSNLKGQAANKAFTEDMADGKISGAMLTKFLTELGALMDSKANLGGRLDVVSSSAESSQARIANAKLERSIKTAEADDGRLRKASNELFKARERLQKSMDTLTPVFSTLEAKSLDLESAFIDLASSVVSYADEVTKTDWFSDLKTIAWGVIETSFTILTTAIQAVADRVLQFWLPDDSQFNTLKSVLDGLVDVLFYAVNKIRSFVGLDELTRAQDQAPANGSASNVKPQQPLMLQSQQPANDGRFALPNLVQGLNERVSSLAASNSTLGANLAAFSQPQTPLGMIPATTNNNVSNVVNVGDIHVVSNSADPRQVAAEVRDSLRDEMDTHFQRNMSSMLNRAGSHRVREQ